MKKHKKDITILQAFIIWLIWLPIAILAITSPRPVYSNPNYNFVPPSEPRPVSEATPKVVAQYISPRDLIIKLMREHGLNEWEIDKFLVIAQRESNFRPDVKNANSSAAGLFQIMSSVFYGEGCQGSQYNAYDNVMCTIVLYRRYGFVPWKLTY